MIKADRDPEPPSCPAYYLLMTSDVEAEPPDSAQLSPSQTSRALYGWNHCDLLSGPARGVVSCCFIQLDSSCRTVYGFSLDIEGIATCFGKLSANVREAGPTFQPVRPGLQCPGS